MGAGRPEARDRRDLLLPALHAVNDRVGWISEGALDYVCRRLTVPPAEAYGVATFYAMFSVRPRPATVLHVCTDLACTTAGAAELCADVERRLGPESGVRVERSPCLGLCERAPAALAVRAGKPSARPAEGDIPARPAHGDIPARPAFEDEEAVRAEETGCGSEAPGDGTGRAAGARHPPRHRRMRPATPATALQAATAPESAPAEPDPALAVPQAGAPSLTLLTRVGTTDPASLDDYRAHGGYTALRRAFDLGPAGVIREVTDAGLLGRGGAAFPTGRKWQATAAQPDHPHYLVCNADESEPGTFKDRVLMEGDPYALVEAMTVAAYATGAHRGYLYLRGEYPRALARLTHAIERARARGLLGDDVMGRGYAFDIEIRRGAGAYVCGEETALFNSIEGRRGEPRSKPPFPVEKGLFGKPTVANNVETLVNVLPILTLGARAYAAIGTPPPPARSCSASRGASPAPASTNFPSARPWASCSPSPVSATTSARSCSAAPPAASCAPTNSTSRSPSRAPARPARHSAPGS